MGKFKKYNMLFAVFILCAALIIIYKSIDNLSSVKDYIAGLLKVVKPFLVGFVIAYVLNMPCKGIRKRLAASKNKFISSKSKGISILSVYLLAVLIIVVVVRAIVPAIYSNVMDMYNNAPAYINKIMVFADYWQTKLGVNLFSAEADITAGKMLEDFLKSFSLTEFSKYAQGVINITSGVINTFIALIVSVYMLIDSELIINGIKSALSVMIGDNRTETVINYCTKVNNIFSKYIYCRVIDAVIIAVLATLVLWVLRVKYAPALGFMIGFCNLIPYFGSIIGTVVTMLITLVTGGLAKMLWTGISLLVMEQIDGNYIGPKIMGEMLEIRPLVVIFAVTVGGGLFGVVGMLISVPVAVVLKMIMEDYLTGKRNRMRGKEQPPTEESCEEENAGQ